MFIDLPITLLFLLVLSSLSNAFTFLLPPGHGEMVSLQMTDYDYEYLPSNEGAPAPYKSDLPSAYPLEAPAGMRGEAVRSALRSGRCICWDLSGSPLKQGLIQVQGKGTIDFLNNKLSQTFSRGGEFKDACLLNGKGRVVDKLSVATVMPDLAYILTSPGHFGSKLFDMLDPLVFPMDRVQLSDLSEMTHTIALASVRQNDVKTCIETYMLPHLSLTESWRFPVPGQPLAYKLKSGGTLIISPSTGLPEVAAAGYSMLFLDDFKKVGRRIFRTMVSEESPEGPIEIGALEYETLRIEAGVPAYGKEITGGDKTIKSSPGPLELHFDQLLDTNKGCYLGQEGVASTLKNKRGPPRQLYQVVFEDDSNMYQHETEGNRDAEDNLTVLPEEGQQLYVLGSAETIAVGTLTSVAEPAGTGDTNILALALVRRADSIQKQMNEQDLSIDDSNDPFTDDPLWNKRPDDISVMVKPPPMDALNGLEVIIGGTFTVGVLRSIPQRRYPRGQNMFLDVVTFDPVIPGEGVETDRISTPTNRHVYSNLVGEAAATEASRQTETQGASQAVPPTPSELQQRPIADGEPTIDTDFADLGDLEAIEQAMEVAKAEADAAAAEAARKAEKMELLKKRAEEALARRKAKEAAQQNQAGSEEVTKPVEDDAAAAEAARKAAKMELLKRRAEEAMARRKAKNEEED